LDWILRVYFAIKQIQAKYKQVKNKESHTHITRLCDTNAKLARFVRSGRGLGHKRERTDTFLFWWGSRGILRLSMIYSYSPESATALAEFALSFNFSAASVCLARPSYDDVGNITGRLLQRHEIFRTEQPISDLGDPWGTSTKRGEDISATYMVPPSPRYVTKNRTQKQQT